MPKKAKKNKAGTDYKKEIKKLEVRLVEIQQAMQKYQIPVIVSFEGLSGAGKGSIINKLLYSLDPGFYNVYTTTRFNEEMKLRPFLWYYWTKTPEKGRLTIFDKSWHRHILSDGVSKLDLTKKEEDNFFYDVNAFEKQLSDDGTVVMKFFLKISKEVQEKRLKELSDNPNTKWRVTDEDWEENKNYSKYLKEFEDVINSTNECKWHVIDTDETDEAIYQTMKTIVDVIDEEISKRKESNRHVERNIVVDPIKPILRNVDPDKVIIDGNYKEQLKHYQEKIRELVYKLYKNRQSVIIAYEGWDAAGKGGNIRRLTQEMDPRSYEVIPIKAPTKEELNHQHLWRFYKRIPKDGHVAIFDRTWYGRVAVERIEGFATRAEWSRAYQEINDMEKHINNHGTIILKFWIHIDPDEQLKRFQAREIDPLKQYKITDEDWRNRAKWPEYEVAIDEMLTKTNTDYAPWHIIESNCKKYARIKVLKIVTETLENALK